jgi:alpha-beta hydrolase superfamily lysophospholipase
MLQTRRGIHVYTGRVVMRRIVISLTAVVTLLAVIGLGVGGWVYSTEILAVPRAGEYDYTLIIEDVDPQAETVTLGVQNSEAVTLPIVGLRTERGSLQLSGTPRFLDTATERRAVLLTGDWPKAGDAAAISVDMYDGDPQETLGVPFETVLIDAELGPMPAWRVIPQDSDPSTWVVLVHGRGAHRPSNNRYLPVLHDLNLPTLSIAIRNDPGVPADPKGYGTFGYAEWRDLDAAVTYLVASEGAERVILVGSSQGASVSLMFLRQSEQAERVAGVVLISPLISLDATLRLAAVDRGIPGPLIRPLLTSAKLVTRLRSGMVFSELEHQKHVDRYPADVPFLITHGDKDVTVPFAPTPRFAAALGARAVFVRYHETGHVREWSADRDRFEADISQFITGDVLGDVLARAS